VRRSALIFIAVGMLAAQEGPSRPGRGGRSTREFLGLGRAPDPVAAARGEKLYTSNCSFCHGAKANGGDTGPDLIRSTVVLHDDKGELITPVIHSGRPDRGMPAFANLSETQLWDIAEFLHMRVELTANRGTYKLLGVVSGNAKAGESYFNADGKCYTCHSVTGDLAHIGSKMEPADLQQAFLYPGARGFEPSGPRITKVTVTLPTGESIAGSLKRLDDFTVSLYDANGDYHSIALDDGVKVDVEDKLLAHRQLLDRYTDTIMHDVLAYLVTLK
jgi:cytochrome c oxidase cbb3-type subunit 3